MFDALFSSAVEGLRTRRFSCALFALLLCVTGAQPGQLDTTFGSGGVLFQPVSAVDNVAATVVLDDTSHMLIRSSDRFVKTGKIFTTLRNVTLSFLPGSPSSYVQPLVITPYDSVVQPTVARLFPGGGVLIAGCATIFSDVPQHVVFATVVSQSTGLPMASFGSGGTVLIPWNATGSGCGIAAVVLQADTFLLLGSGRSRITGIGQMMAVKMFYNGTLDSWGEDGKLFFGSIQSEAVCGFLLPNQHVLVAGTFSRGSRTARVQVQVLTADGIVVQSDLLGFESPFQRNGTFANASLASSCVRLPTGAFVVAGTAGEHVAALRLKRVANDTGVVLDTTFGFGGSVVLEDFRWSRSSPRSVLSSVMPSGAVVLSASVPPFPYGFRTMRVLPSGAVDPTWQSVPFQLGAGVEFPEVVAVDVTRYGKLVLSGRAIVPQSSAFSFVVTAEPSAVPCAAGPQCLCVGLDCMTQGDYVAPPSTAQSAALQQLINGTISVNGNLIGSEGGRVTVRPPPFGAGQITVGGTTLATGGVLVVQVNQSGTYDVLSSTGGIVGDFTILVDPSTLKPCDVGDTVVMLSPDGTMLSVLVSVHRTTGLCLTPAETIGVAIGAVVGGLLVAAVIVFIVRRQTQLYTTRRNAELKEDTLLDVRKPNPAFGSNLEAQEL
jgi:hypothetical protein